jgi:hypothetical protein
VLLACCAHAASLWGGKHAPLYPPFDLFSGLCTSSAVPLVRPRARHAPECFLNSGAVRCCSHRDRGMPRTRRLALGGQTCPPVPLFWPCYRPVHVLCGPSGAPTRSPRQRWRSSTLVALAPALPSLSSSFWLQLQLLKPACALLTSRALPSCLGAARGPSSRERIRALHLRERPWRLISTSGAACTTCCIAPMQQVVGCRQLVRVVAGAARGAPQRV